MNLYSFLWKKHKSLFAGAFFAVAFFSSLLLTPTFAHADYEKYKNLFSGSSPKAALKIQSTTSPVVGATAGERKVDLNFVFEGSFPVTKEENPGNPLAGHDKKWYWDLIRDFGDSDHVFMLRICDTSITDENKCMFSIVPHVSDMSDDESLFCPSGGQCVLPNLNTYISKKIYHYTAVPDMSGTSLMHSNIQFDKFRTKFAVPSLAYLKGVDELDTPLNLNDVFKIGSTTVYKADMWYCGDKADTDPAFPTADSIDEPNIRLFKKLCGDGHPYFKIAESNTFHMPESLAAAATETPEELSNQGTGPTDSDGNLPSCGVVSGSIMGCVAQIVYYLIFNPIQWVAGIIGRAFDFFLGYSISDESYRAGVIVTGWRLVRDISNIFFILILVWTGIATIFGISKISMKSVVPQLIINALLINFSLFGARVVIDISNVTARLFYNTMSVCDGECRYRTDEKTGKQIIDNPNKETTGGFKPLSTKIVAAFDPQRIMNPAILDPSNTTNTEGANQQGSADLQKLAAGPTNKDDYAGYFIIVTLIAAFIMFGMAKMFFSVMFMFLGRVVGLYIVMIFAPFAVMTRGGMPLVGSISKELGWDSWKKDLTSYALLAPVFVFFLYIIYAFINSDFMKALHVGDAAGFMGTVLGIVIPMAIIYMLVQQGVTVAKKFSGKIGELVDGAFKSTAGLVGGAALGIATGGAALAGTRFGARAGRAIGNTSLGKWAAKNADSNALARKVNNGLSASQTGSWDFRKTKLADMVQKNSSKLLSDTGITFKDKVSGKIGLSEKRFEGGFKGQQKRRQEKIKKNIESRIKFDHLNDEQAKALWKEKSDKEFEQKEKLNEKQMEFLNDLGEKLMAGKGFMKDAADQLQAQVKSGARAAYNKDDVETLAKENRDRWKNANSGAGGLITKKQEFDKKKTDTYGKVENVKDLTNATRRDYAQDLRDNSFWMKGGEQRKIFGTVVGSLFGGPLLAERLRFEQEALDEATKSYIKDYGKTKGKSSKIDQYKATIGKINETIEDIVKKAEEAAGRTFTKLSEVDKDIQESHVKEHIANQQADFDVKNANYKKKEQEFQAGRASEDELKEASKEKQKAEDNLNRVKNIWKTKDETEEKIAKEEEKNKPKDDKGGDKDKKDDKAK